MNAQQTKQKGFTIIEVVLVLAIAGLIFLMVFIALPALQRNQRDTARKGDASALASAFTTATNNSRGTPPADATIPSTQFGTSGTGVPVFARYIDNLSGNSTSVIIRDRGTATTVTPADGELIIVKAAKCGTDEGTMGPGTKRQIAIFTLLEGGDAVFCQGS